MRKSSGDAAVDDRYSRPVVRVTPNVAWSNDTAAPLFDFGSVWRLLRRRLGLVAVITFVCLLIVVTLHSYTPRYYTAKTRILLDQKSINPFGRNEIFTDLKLTNPVIESQMQLIRSPYLLSLVVDRLKLGDNKQFMAEPTTPLREAMVPLRDAIASFRSSMGLGGEKPRPMGEAERFQAAVERLHDNLVVNRNALTLVFSIGYTSPSPQLSADVVNAVAKTYIDNRSEIRQASAKKAASWFDDRMAELNTRARAAEARIGQLRAGTSGAAGTSQSAAVLQGVREALQQAMAERSRTHTQVARLRAIVANDRGLRGMGDGLGSDTLATLITKANVARAELEKAQGTLPPDDPRIKALNLRIKSFEVAGRTLLASMLKDAETRAAGAELSQATARAAFESARSVGGGSLTNSIEVELRTLEGEARIYRELYDGYLKSYLSTIQQQSFPASEATIIERALPPRVPENPGLSRLGLLGILIGLTLGVGGAFLADAADGRVRSLAQLIRATGAPVLGLLPPPDQERKEVARKTKSQQLHLPYIALPNRPHGDGQDEISLPENRLSLVMNAPQLYAAINDPLSNYSESIRRVKVEADNVHGLLEPDSRSGSVIGFISDGFSSGRSIAATNYAEMLAVGGSRTLLVDLDWTGLFLSKKVTPTASLGLADLTMPNRDLQLNHALWYDNRTGLHFLPNRSLDKDVALDPAVFDQTRLKTLINILAGQFDNVILDMSPLSTSSDAAALANAVTGYVAVAEWGKTLLASLKSELARAAISPPKLVGTLLNGVSAKRLKKYETAA